MLFLQKMRLYSTEKSDICTMLKIIKQIIFILLTQLLFVREELPERIEMYANNRLLHKHMSDVNSLVFLCK